MQLGGCNHLHRIAGASAHERYPCPGDRIGAAHDLLLIAGQVIGQQQQGPVRPGVDLGQARRRRRASLAQALVPERRGCRGDGEPLAAERGDDDAQIGRSRGGDLPGSLAASRPAARESELEDWPTQTQRSSVRLLERSSTPPRSRLVIPTAFLSTISRKRRRYRQRPIVLSGSRMLLTPAPTSLERGRRQRASAAGSSTTKVEPSPSFDSTEIVPAIRRTSSRLMYRPSPVPPIPRVMSGSSR